LAGGGYQSAGWGGISAATNNDGQFSGSTFSPAFSRMAFALG
jgi:hypothetical protein